jgi:hypothetical protein
MPNFDYKEVHPEHLEVNFKFVKKLWSEGGDDFVEGLFKSSDPDDLATKLQEEGLKFPRKMQFVLIDVARGRTKSFPDSIDKRREWYVLVLPPKPSRSTDPQYIDLQAWSEASFHASNDGYGM